MQGFMGGDLNSFPDITFLNMWTVGKLMGDGHAHRDFPTSAFECIL